MNLQELENTAAKCELCNLYKGRNKAVFAKGNPEADMMICGMCPGPDENEAGVPFVGKAGGVLDYLIRDAFNIEDYSKAYITNLVKCFVAPGTKLDPEWMSACLPYFFVQLNLMKPKVIITLGKDVANFLLGNENAMGSLRGNIYQYGKHKLVPTYHPSYLARQGGTKSPSYARVVKDFKKAEVLLEGI